MIIPKSSPQQAVVLHAILLLARMSIHLLCIPVLTDIWSAALAASKVYQVKQGTCSVSRTPVTGGPPHS